MFAAANGNLIAVYNTYTAELTGILRCLPKHLNAVAKHACKVLEIGFKECKSGAGATAGGSNAWHGHPMTAA